MLVRTKYFGVIDLADDKIIEFPQGIMGFENYKKYTVLYDLEDKNNISWLQSIEEESLAIPIVNPYVIKPDYNPVVEDELLKFIGELTEENVIIFLTMTVPVDVTKTSVNLKAPFIINSDTRKGCQIITENTDYEIKYNIYEHVQRLKQQKGETQC